MLTSERASENRFLWPELTLCMLSVGVQLFLLTAEVLYDTRYIKVRHKRQSHTEAFIHNMSEVAL